jgi:8-oxo-dGTP pyrophosphatase MutT (NUDIX family)
LEKRTDDALQKPASETVENPAPATVPLVRPVDAAGLVLLRQGARGGPEVLMGRRHGKAKFLPDIYVFPGGRVDPQDRLPSGFAEHLAPGVETALRRAAPRKRPASYLRAALRETFEETGLLLGAPGAKPAHEPAAEIWRQFAARGLAPRFEGFDYICRAITPRGSHRRYNTRFFLGDGATAEGSIAGDGELEDLAWRPVEAMAGLNLVDVTEYVLAEALRRWRRGHRPGLESPTLFRYIKDIAKPRQAGTAGAG